MLGTTIAATALLLSPLEQIRFGRSAMAAALYYANLWFVRASLDYFSDEVASNPVLHTWSLSVEEQFYLVWRLVMLLAARRGGSLRGAALWVAVVTTASLAGSLWLTEVHRPWAFFGTATRVWEFGAGALTALLPAPARTRHEVHGAGSG